MCTSLHMYIHRSTASNPKVISLGERTPFLKNVALPHRPRNPHVHMKGVRKPDGRRVALRYFTRSVLLQGLVL